jgi:hypothetical protein
MGALGTCRWSRPPVRESGSYPPDLPEDWLLRRYAEIVSRRTTQVAEVLTLLSRPGLPRL